MKKTSTYTLDAIKALSERNTITKLELAIDKKQGFEEYPIFEYINDLSLYAHVKTDMHLLKKFPNVEKLWLLQKFTEATSISNLKKLKELTIADFKNVEFSHPEGIPIEKLSVRSCLANENFSELLSGSTKSLNLSELRKVEDLNFIHKAPNLEYLILSEFSLPALPDFSQLPQLKLLFMYGLHKTNDIESLIDSSIEYLHVCVSSDKVSGKAFANILMQMKNLKKYEIHNLDYSDKRSRPLINELKKNGKDDLLTDNLRSIISY
ncbi:MAG: hypothetical protein LBV71_05855 [Prevotella sp.]|jgi:hypothetical protein|nr:hypothetical protein [Prevotella sp.]